MNTRRPTGALSVSIDPNPNAAPGAVRSGRKRGGGGVVTKLRADGKFTSLDHGQRGFRGGRRGGPIPSCRRDGSRILPQQSAGAERPEPAPAEGSSSEIRAPSRTIHSKFGFGGEALEHEAAVFGPPARCAQSAGMAAIELGLDKKSLSSF